MRPLRATLTGVLFLVAACGGDAADQEAAPASEMESAAEPAAEAMAPDLASVELPEGVTHDMVQAGSELWTGLICTTCHGPDARGVEMTGPNLVDDAWLNSDGTYDAIVQTIMDGVEQPQEFAGIMLPKGGDPSITEEQVQQVAAYIYAASRQPAG